MTSLPDIDSQPHPDMPDGREILMATCGKGMAHSLRACGQTHETALNPRTEPEAVAALRAALKAARIARERADALDPEGRAR